MSNERSESAKLIKEINEILNPGTQLSDHSIRSIINGLVQTTNVSSYSLASFHAFLSAVKQTLENKNGYGFGTK